MSGLAARIDSRAPAAATSPDQAASAASWHGLLLRLGPFVALCAFGIAHWSLLVADPPAARAIGVTAVAAGGGALLWLSGRVAISRPLAVAARVAVAVAMLALALVAMGLPAHLLKPAHWGELSENLDLALAQVQNVSWPYDGRDEWVRLTLLLGAPLAAVAAAALAFWPVRRGAGIMRASALVLLVAMFGVAVTERTLDSEIARGFVLFLLIAAWLWLPRLRPSDLAAGGAVALAAAVLALPVSARLDGEEPWINYQSWQWFTGGGAVTFDWTHEYGPLDWPRKGTTLLKVKSDKPHYWKVQTLDRFDGLRWVNSIENAGSGPGAERPSRFNAEWLVDFEVTINKLQTDLAVTAGRPYNISGAGPTITTGDGTTKVVNGPLRKGDKYAVQAYVPEPKAADMRAADTVPSAALTQYTRIALPAPGVTAREGVGRQGDAARSAARPEDVVSVPLRNDPYGNAELDLDYARQLRASPYEEMYRLALRVTRDAPTTYDAVRRVERELRASGNYTYSERVPTRDYPLAGFLFEDRAGYCQQFSGAMALMLRMNGIPARVATGFTPGSYNRDTKEYRVRDLDAHSWVEVYFDTIGWVTFDPTPPLTPAESQLDSSGAIPLDDDPAGDDTARGAAAERGTDTGAGFGEQGGGTPAWVWPLALLAVAAIATGGLWLRSTLRWRRTPGAEARVRELEAALRRLGYTMPPGTTLSALERRLARIAGPEAGRYVHRLLRARFGSPAHRADLPTARDRRALRHALTRGSGPIGKLKGLMALPPRA